MSKTTIKKETKTSRPSRTSEDTLLLLAIFQDHTTKHTEQNLRNVLDLKNIGQTSSASRLVLVLLQRWFSFWMCVYTYSRNESQLLHECYLNFQVLEACCFVPVSSNAFTLKMEDAITNIYFSKNEKQRTEFFKLMSK